MISSKSYIANVKNALASNLSAWFPPDKEKRIQMNIRLAHEFGYGIAAYDNWREIIKSTYGELIVSHSFDSVGVVIDNKEWIKEIEVGARQYFAYKKLTMFNS